MVTAPSGSEDAGLVLSAEEVGLWQRFWSKVEKTQTCWVWRGSLTDGYGYIYLERGRQARAHRLSYEWLVGPIPLGLVIDHLCRNRACVRPDHLEPVTVGENIRRGDMAARLRNRSLCRNGLHPWPQSAYKRSDGWEECRPCADARFAKKLPHASETVACEMCGIELRRDTRRRHQRTTKCAAARIARTPPPAGDAQGSQEASNGPVGAGGAGDGCGHERDDESGRGAGL